MYRDDREALLAKLDHLAGELAKRESDEAGVRVELERRLALREAARRARHRPYLIVLAVVVALCPLAYLRYTSAIPQVEAREARSVELEARRARAADAVAARRDAADEARTRYQAPPEVTPELSALYGELRFLNARDPAEAWLIVGSVSCARRDDATVEQAQAALPQDARPRLDALCAPWRPAR